MCPRGWPGNGQTCRAQHIGIRCREPLSVASVQGQFVGIAPMAFGLLTAYLGDMTKSSHPLRVISCCYCGARSTLKPEPGQRLLCHGCGAPITKLEPLQASMERKRKKRGTPKPAIPHHAEGCGGHLAKDRPQRRKKGKRRKRSIWYHIGEAFDDFDDILDIFD